MGVKRFNLSLSVSLRVLIILKNRYQVYGANKGVFVEEIANIIGRSKTTINDVLRFLEDKELILRNYEASEKPGNKRKENFISQSGLTHLKNELNPTLASLIDRESKTNCNIKREKTLFSST